ncbi:hypothetical protein ADEAN_000523900 [Angomonas deanei]|uniref:Uncharacterized protein n=1 Tax=Angomonas deanei TaxID=59799 RepID=A0A7G2CE38_9TRYP|nr:hypothetical protein ADEAN_000523900 [Angomonas deanei]
MELFVPLNALITSSDNGVVLVTSMVTGKTLHTVNVNTATTLESRHSTVRSFAVHARLKMMVTIGAERYGLVWDMATERVVAQLDPHNAPLKCCGISDKLEEIITCSGDGVIQLYDCNGFQLVQRIELGRLHAVSLLSISSVSQSLFCFGRYPFQIRSKRQASSNCPANYTGHFGAMLGSLYSKTFDQIITVDTDALAMTWVATTGKPIFSFVFNDFSDSATMNSARVTSISMDGLQRRILTGYNNGAMVVWNAVNGQPINFMTAAIPGAQRLLYPKDPEEEEKEKALQKAKPWRQGNTKERSGSVLHVSDGDDPANEEPDDDGEDQYGNVSEVTATGSLVRRGVTFFLFHPQNTVQCAGVDRLYHRHRNSLDDSHRLWGRHRDGTSGRAHHGAGHGVGGATLLPRPQ